jgi:hypothetical protein
MLAAVHAGQFENLSAASDTWVEFVDAQEPNVGWQEVYEERYRSFCGLHV